MSRWDFLIDFLGISFLWKVNRVGEIESKLQVNLEEIFMSKWDFLIDFLCISFLWKVNRVVGLESKLQVNWE